MKSDCSCNWSKLSLLGPDLSCAMLRKIGDEAPQSHPQCLACDGVIEDRHEVTSTRQPIHSGSSIATLDT